MVTLPTLRTVVKKSPGHHEARHLLIHSVDGSLETVLSQMTNGFVTRIATGTEYEMKKRADEMVQSWIDNEGFQFPRENAPVFEPLKHAIALATSMGYTHLYDARYKNITLSGPGKMNITGAVRLAEWPGLAGKNGGDYEYALEGNGTLIASPTLPRGHGLNMTPQTAEETISVLQKAVALKESVGPTVTFLLTGN